MRLRRQIYSGEGYHFSGQQLYCYAFDTLHPQTVSAELLVYSISLLLTLSNMHNPNWNVFSLGGMLSYTTMSSTRTLALSALDNFMPTKAFLSCHSITRDFYATDSYMEDVELKRRALDISAETFLLADAPN